MGDGTFFDPGSLTIFNADGSIKTAPGDFDSQTFDPSLPNFVTGEALPEAPPATLGVAPTAGQVGGSDVIGELGTPVSVEASTGGLLGSGPGAFDQLAAGGQMIDPITGKIVPKLAHGGTGVGTAIVGDSPSGRPTGVEELVIDPTRDSTVIPLNGASPPGFLNDILGGREAANPEGDFIDRLLDRLIPPPTDDFANSLVNSLPPDIPRLAHGGVVGGASNVDAARSFLEQASQKALANSPFGTFPTPIELAAPGTPNFLRQAAAGLTSTARGINPDVFLNELLRLTPRGVPAGIVGRTA